MSARPADDDPEEAVDTENVGGLEEIVPPRLMPIWRRIQLIQDFRSAYGRTYVKFAEAIIALVLTGGYLYWLSLYLAA
ncbi:hypothetical protein [Natrinema salifodinae]|uniref:Uncharacterized protein n=1 Tax=Natrinema salifodinae TaxID=1202768 RepID=A0A1I0MF44_9EURY|nr:hypothetical protein [Natrinema salifodinae]SEV86390.1 hypothetical protein SAMN05216285_0830 [Natrinema salifodinae]